VLPTVDEPEKRHHCSASPKSGSCVRGTHSRQTHDIGLAYKMALNGCRAHVEQYSRHISEGPQYPRPCRWLCALRLASLRRTRACLPVRRWEAGRLPQPDLAELLQFRQDGNLSHLELSHCNWVYLHITQTRCHSVFEAHSSSVFFHDRCVATEITVNFEPLLRA
jgi:hypothetical protein